MQDIKELAITKGFTYRIILELLQTIPDEELDNTATIYDRDEDEFYPITIIGRADDGQPQLDFEHLYFGIK